MCYPSSWSGGESAERKIKLKRGEKSTGKCFEMTDFGLIATWGRSKPNPALLELCHTGGILQQTHCNTQQRVHSWWDSGMTASYHTARWHVKTWWHSWKKKQLTTDEKQHSFYTTILLTYSKLSPLWCFPSKTCIPAVGNKNRSR